jgi:undecaprenyl-diphosphatase
VAVIGLLLIIAVVAPHGGPLTPLKAIVLGLVEGITEFLPVSSTGHLLVVQRLLGLTGTAGDQAANTYAVAIQAGAILAVLSQCRHRVVELANGLVGRDDEGRRLLITLVIAFLPAGLVGLVAGSTITDHLFALAPVIFAWVVGGVFLLWWQPRRGRRPIMALGPRDAIVIGCVQLLALWPGTSRSLVTIVAAVALGATMTAAVEFSFLLGLVTLGAATALDLVKHGGELVDVYGWVTPLLGAAVAFVAASFAVSWLLVYLRTHPLRIFGWYRLGVAALALGLLAVGAL